MPARTKTPAVDTVRRHIRDELCLILEVPFLYRHQYFFNSDHSAAVVMFQDEESKKYSWAYFDQHGWNLVSLCQDYVSKMGALCDAFKVVKWEAAT